MRRVRAVWLLLCLLIASAFGTQQMVAQGWRRLIGFSPSHFSVPTPTAGSPQLADRLVLIMVDGLRVEDAGALPTIDLLRRQGASFSLKAPSPGYPAPALATLLTGALPQHHGVLFTAPDTPLQADSLPRAAIRARVTAGGAGSAALGSLISPYVAQWHTTTSSDDVLEAARSLLTPNGPRLVLLQIDGLHSGIHWLGTADRKEKRYETLLTILDQQLLQILPLIDLRQTAIIVTGSMPTGAHGEHLSGEQIPMVMAGAGIKAGYLGEGALTDIAPTAALLLGTPIPLQSSGRPLLEALQVEGRPADLLAYRYMSVRKSFSDAILQSLGALELAPDAPESALEANGYLKRLSQLEHAAAFAYWKQALLKRLPYVGGAILLLLLYLLVAFRQPFGRPLLAGVLTYALSFHLIFFASGGRYAGSMTGLESLDRTTAAALGLRAAIAMIPTVMVAGYLLSRHHFKRRTYIMGAALHMALCVATSVALPVAVALAIVGWDFPVELPSAGLMIWFFVAALQVVIIGYLSPIWAPLTVATIDLFRRLWPPPPVAEPDPAPPKAARSRSVRRAART